VHTVYIRNNVRTQYAQAMHDATEYRSILESSLLSFFTMSSIIAFINNFLSSLERNEQSSDSKGEEHIALAPADEEAIGNGVEGDGSNGQAVEDDFCHGNSNESAGGGEDHTALMAPAADEEDISDAVEGAGITPVEEDFFYGNSNESAGGSSEEDFCHGNSNESAGGGEDHTALMAPAADEEAISDAVEGAGITPIEEDFFYGNSNESAGGSSEISLASVDQEVPSDNSSDESDGNNDSDFEADGENVAPVRDRGAVLRADKLVSSNPMKDILRKTKTKERSPAEILASRTRFREYLLELFSLPNCFCKYQRTFTQCSCLNQLKDECCYDSISARLGKLFCQLVVSFNAIFY
jgi:hypothetical protein